jgi:hypothetical protein
MAEEAAELALAREQFADEIADVRGFDLAGFDAGRDECGFGNVAEQLEQPAALAFEIAREVGLRAAEDEDVLCHVRLPFREWRAPFRALRCASPCS